MLQTKDKVVKGDCEVCSQTDVELTLRHGNIMMCPSCLAEDLAVVKHAEKVIEDSRNIDATIELRQDLHRVGSIAFTELQAAIQNNPEIPAEKKNYAVMVEVAARIETLSAAIFADEAALLAKKNQRHALLVNAQHVAVKLHEKEREKFKQYDINYKPVTPKSVKPAKVKAPSNKYTKKELYDAARKYNVSASQIQMVVQSRNMSPDEAGKYFAGLMGLL